MTRRIALLVLCGASLAHAGGDTIVSSKHDLSVTGGGRVRSATETQVCIFCHVGHGQGPGGNRPELRSDYTPYASSTLTSAMSASPTGASRICLSCHDGTIALGETVASGTIEVLGAGPGGRIPEGDANLGTDLRKTHPVSFVPRPSPKYHPPEGGAVKLDRSGQLQCTSCHDPHREAADPERKKFLVQQNRHSALCVSCHSLEAWSANPSAHQSSTAATDPSRTAVPYPYRTVAENACESCHRPHNASENGRLVRGHGAGVEQQVCLDCHNGRVARTDLTVDLSKAFAHQQPAGSPSVHDAAESPRQARFQLPEGRNTAPRHVTCVDCHNPHAAFNRPAVGLTLSGALAGVWGVDQRGERVEQVKFEYEVCLKCHGDSANKPLSWGAARPQPPQREKLQGPDNLKLAFGSNAASAHPVIQPGTGADVPSLKPEYAGGRTIACSACHNSDTGPAVGGSGPNGPHGSNFSFLLERNLETSDRTPESPAAYALCYKCHEREVVLSDRSAFKLHRQHVVDSSTPCTACHNSHGVSAQRATRQGGAHLMDYDTNIVAPGTNGRREYFSQGGRSGACTVACHGKVHDGTKY